MTAYALYRMYHYGVHTPIREVILRLLKALVRA